MANPARVLGVHPIASQDPVHLVELEVEGSEIEFDFSEITQEVPGQPRSNWQVAYDEREIGVNRYAFFFHFLDTARPLLTPVGPLALPPESPAPEHLHRVEYEKP
jgi:hypothetical protein